MSFLMLNKFWIVIICFALFAVFIGWSIINQLGVKARGRRRISAQKSQRRSDNIVLSSAERKMLKEAERMMRSGNTISAAKIYEQIGMHREAIQVLEEGGFVHEAAKILMRMGKHNRAGVIYARYGLWEFAAKCFQQAHMPLEVAKCAKEAGDLTTAAQYFETAGYFEEAADCLLQLRELKKAAWFYVKGNKYEKAFNTYSQMGSQSAIDGPFAPEEIQFITNCFMDRDILLKKNIENLAKIADKLLLSKSVIQKLVISGYLRQAVQVFKNCKHDLCSQIVSEINFQTDTASSFADFFIEAQKDNYAAIVFEKIQNFSKAAEYFEKSEDWERASYCYERSGQLEKAQATRSRSVALGARRSHKHTKEAKFTLGDDTDQNIVSSNHLSPPSESEESTAILTPGPTVPLAKSTNITLKILEKEADSGQIFSLSNEQTNAPDMGDKVLQMKPVQPSTGLGEKKPLEDDLFREMPPPPPVADLRIIPSPPRVSSHLENPDQIQNIFKNTKLFSDLEEPHLRALWELSISKNYSPQTKILTYNDEPLGIYVILHGKVNCFRRINGQETYLDQMVAGESFGELWLLTDSPSNVSFVAATDVTLRIIERVSFTNFLDNDGTVARKVYKRFTTRLMKRLLTTNNLNEKKEAS